MRALSFAAMVSVTAAPVMAAPADVKASVAATAARSEDNVKLDESRKPAQLLSWLGWVCRRARASPTCSAPTFIGRKFSDRR